MDWIRQNNFLATFGGIMLVGILGLGFFTFSSWKGYTAAIDKFDSTNSKLTDLEGAPLHPNSENVQKVKTKVDAYEKAVNELYAKLKAAQPALPDDVDATEFGEKVQAKLKPFMEKAENLGITVGGNFYMGMDRYIGEQPANKTDVLQKLEWSLGGIAVLADLTVEAGVQSIDRFRRYEEPWENSDAKPEVVVEKKTRGRSGRASRDRGRGTPKPPKASAKMADISEASRVRMRITGTPESITKYFNLISNNEEYFFWIRWAKIANEVPKGPRRDQVFNPMPVGDDPIADGDVPEDAQIEEIPEGDPVDAGPEVEVAPAMIDVFPILGTERVRADVVIDIVRFRDPPAPKKTEKKTSSR